MPTLMFVGDTHGSLIKMYKDAVAWMERTDVKIDGIVQVGDLGVYFTGTSWATMWHHRAPAPIPTWAIMGNHEDPKAISAWQEEPDRIPDMHLLPDGAITNVLGVNIGGVWGNYSPISWLNPERVRANRLSGQSERIAMHIDRDAVERLKNAPERMDVLVTHDSASSTMPSMFRGSEMSTMIKVQLGLEDREDPCGCPGFDDLLRMKAPQLYFFGHLHCRDHGVLTTQNIQYSQNTQYTCLNAVGFFGGDWFDVHRFPEEG